MKLVACATCHTQYDISNVEAESFACRCGERVRVQSLRPVDAVIHRCGSCGANVASDATRCDYCTSEIVQDRAALSLICPECCARNAERSRYCTACGVGFDPHAVPLQGAGDPAASDHVTELPCPCCGMLMPRRAIGGQSGGVQVHECPSCNGLWVPEDRFDHLVQRALATRREQLASGMVAAPRVSGAVPSMTVAYRKCPVCEGFMHRRNFQKRSGVIVDVCKKHGTWLDADELEQITGFILSGGLTEAQVIEDQRQAAALRREAARAAHEIRVSSPSRDHSRGNQDRGGILGTVLELFELVLS